MDGKKTPFARRVVFQPKPMKANYVGTMLIFYALLINGGSRVSINSGIVREVTISGRGVDLPGFLAVPDNACCIVIFAHGSGSSRFSGRNQQVARVLNKGGIATLLFDLLTPEESADRSNVFDIDLLAGRLLIATNWVRKNTETSGMSIGYFGASTGAAAALKAASSGRFIVFAIVSRGGRPDLAWEVLEKVDSPTMLIVGSGDYGVVELNESSYNKLRCIKRMDIVPKATHLFEEPGTLERVAELARDWFLQNAGKRKIVLQRH